MSTMDKVKNALHLNKDHNTTTSTHHNTSSGVPEGTAGPHNSRVANAADPRVDSDRKLHFQSFLTPLGEKGLRSSLQNF
jgi:hypothetical protein